MVSGLSRLALAAALALAAPLPASAQTINSHEYAEPYASVRGWDVYVMSDGRGRFSCRAVRGAGYNDQLMIEYNGFAETEFGESPWRLYLPAQRPGGGGVGIQGAAVYYDGYLIDRQVGFGLPGDDGSSDTHAWMGLGDSEMARLKSGNTLRVEITGETSRSYPLAGTTATVLKTWECAERNGMLVDGD